MKCSCSGGGGDIKIKKYSSGGGGDSFLSFVTQVRSTPVGGDEDDDDGGEDDADDGEDDDGSKDEATVGFLGEGLQPGPVFVLRNPWFRGSLVDWFNQPRPVFHVWSLGAAPVAPAARGASSTSVEATKEKRIHNNAVVLTNGGAALALLAAAVVAAVASSTWRRRHASRTNRGNGCAESSLDGERLPLLLHN